MHLSGRCWWSVGWCDEVRRRIAGWWYGVGLRHLYMSGKGVVVEAIRCSVLRYFCFQLARVWWMVGGVRMRDERFSGFERGGRVR
jgi:hypothetical protein